MRTKLLGLVDLQDTPAAEAMADAIAWTLITRYNLDITKLIIFTSDNTNSMSGLRGGVAKTSL